MERGDRTEADRRYESQGRSGIPTGAVVVRRSSAGETAEGNGDKRGEARDRAAARAEVNAKHTRAIDGSRRWLEVVDEEDQNPVDLQAAKEGRATDGVRSTLYHVPVEVWRRCGQVEPDPEKQERSSQAEKAEAWAGHLPLVE